MSADVDDEIPIVGKVRKGRFYFESLSDKEFWNKRKVNVFRRKANKETYLSPMIVLDSKYKDLIGKYYSTLIGRAVYKTEFYGKVEEKKGDCLVLFFCDEWKNESKPIVKRGI